MKIDPKTLAKLQQRYDELVKSGKVIRPDQEDHSPEARAAHLEVFRDMAPYREAANETMET